MIVADGLHKAYGSRRAVDGVSFQAEDFQIFGLLGPNGAGKTTTMHMLAGLLQPDKGKITIQDAVDPTRRRVRRKLGVAPQSLAIYEDLTAEENLRFFGHLYGLRGKALTRNADWLLEFVGLQDRARERVKGFSGGMARRLNFACALIHEPMVVLLDEPMVGVDPQSRARLMDCVQQLRDAGCSVVYTTHYMEEAEALCDRVAIMDGGRILALDSVPELIARFGGRPRVSLELLEQPADDFDLPGELVGDRLVFETERPIDSTQELAAHGLHIGSVNIRQPNLEAVFLNLTGRLLRD